MNGILFIDFNLVACDFLKFDWCKMLNGHVNFLFNISLRMTVVLVKHYKIEDGLSKTWITFTSCIL